MGQLPRVVLAARLVQEQRLHEDLTTLHPLPTTHPDHGRQWSTGGGQLSRVTRAIRQLIY